MVMVVWMKISCVVFNCLFDEIDMSFMLVMFVSVVVVFGKWFSFELVLV